MSVNSERLDAIRKRLKLQEPKWPEVPEDLVEFLEAIYPPKCMDRVTSVEEHLRYAGAVELVELLRFKVEETKELASTDALEVELQEDE